MKDLNYNKKMLIKPLITEKSTLAIKKKNCYTFIASHFYNKTQFKIELKKIYNIQIEFINSMNYNPKIKNNKNKKYYLNKKKGNLKKFLVKIKGKNKIIFSKNKDIISQYNKESSNDNMNKNIIINN